MTGLMMASAVDVRVGDVPKPWRKELGLEGKAEDERVRVSVETMQEHTRRRLSARDMIGAAERMGLAPRQSDVIVDDVRALRDEWND